MLDEDGCGALLRLCDVASHERDECDFANVQCSHADPETDEPCKFLGPRGLLAMHAASCPLRPVECEHCGICIAADNETAHAMVCPLLPQP